jgi:hypothetical protein
MERMTDDPKNPRTTACFENGTKDGTFFLQMAQNLYEIPWKWVNIDVPCDVFTEFYGGFDPFLGHL